MAPRSQKLKLSLEDLIVLDPLTDNQRKFFQIAKKKDLIILHGVAGTGKTYIALYKSFEEILDASSKYRKLIIVRSAVPSRDVGFLPGSIDDKSEVYEIPYYPICSDLFRRQDAYLRLKEQKVLEFMTTSHIRGLTLNNSIILVDEVQNMNFQEISSIITRAGVNTKIVFCGDFRQTDLNKRNDKSGLNTFLNIASKMSNAFKIEFGVEDIVRSQLVKEFIIASLDTE